MLEAVVMTCRASRASRNDSADVEQAGASFDDLSRLRCTGSIAGGRVQLDFQCL